MWREGCRSDRELWLGFDDAGKEAWRLQSGINPWSEAAKTAIEAKSKSLAFQVVFQRGLLLSASVIDNARAEIDWELDLSDRFAVIEEWIRRVNERICAFLGEPAFWRGTGIKLEGATNYTKTGSRGIQGLVTLAAFINPHEIASIAGALPKSRPSLLRRLTKQERELDLLAELGGTGSLLSSDRGYPSARTGGLALQLAVWRWVSEQFDRIGPGRPGGVVNGVLRQAAAGVRNSVRSYVRSDARAVSEEYDGDQEGLAIRVLVARRLTSVVGNALDSTSS